MISLGSLLAAVLVLAQSPATDSIRLRARTGSDTVLLGDARKRSMDVRDAVSDALARSVKAPFDERDLELRAAARLAAAYANVWRDSFPVRQVDRFLAATPEQRAAKVSADSVRRAGVNAYGELGPRAGIARWRRALARSRAIDDSAGIAATLGNMGAAFSRLDETDTAAVYLTAAARIAHAIGDARVEANALAEIGGLREASDDIPGARDAYAKAIALRERIGDSRGLAADYNNLGLLAERIGDVSAARTQFDAALTLNKRDGRDLIAATNLVNLAGLSSQAGEFSRAESLYREALATWRGSQRWPDVADALRGLGQLEIRRGDYPKARVQLREAITLYDRVGLVNEAIATRQHLAGALAAAGQLQSAIGELRRAQRIADSIDAPAGVRGGLTLARADIAAQLNSDAEADRLYSAAQSLFRGANDRSGEAEALQGRGQILIAQHDLTRARELLESAVTTQQMLGNGRAAALTRLSLAALLLEQGDTTGARRQLVRSVADLDRLGDPVGAGAALGQRAALESAARSPVLAESLYAAGLMKVGSRNAPQVTWQLHAGLASLRRRAGAIEDAAREFRAAIADIERAQRSLAAPQRRSSFLADKADVYAQLAMLEQSRGRVAAAFELSERLRAREMVEMLGEGRISLPGAAGELADREQDLRRRISTLVRELDADGSPDQPLRGAEAASRSAVTREALARAQSEYSDLLLELRDRAPAHAALVSLNGANVRDVAARLSTDEAFIEYLLSDTTSLAFVVTRDTVAAVDLGIDQRALAKTIDFVRGTLRPRGNPRVDSLWRAPLRELHARLVAPLEESGVLMGKTRLTIVPHAELHYLPFGALIDRLTGRFLIERYEIVVTPSASVWLALAARGARQSAGVLTLAPRPAALPASRNEVNAIARLAGADTRVLIGSSATEDTFRREASSRRVLHFATYGVLNKQNPMFSYIDLAPGGGEDGRLEVNEVFGLSLNADLVVLSACQTALASGALTDLPAGDDWVGLARAFLHAGAARVVASLWAVEDRATATLMERFYRSYSGGAAAGTALATAQRALLRDRATTHPFYWAGFQVVGEQ